MMNKKLHILLSVLLSCASPAAARKLVSVDLSRSYSSIVINEDTTVSFCYCESAKQVYVQTDMLFTGEDSTHYNDLHTRKIKMKRQSDGCFHVTTRPVHQETYTYCFRINGKRKPDPLNKDTAWQMIHQWNIVSIGGTPQADLYLPPKQKGRLIQTRWFDSKEQLYRRVRIYLPAEYDKMTNAQSPLSNYPVLYLIHGINGYEGSWMERGRAIQIVENLTARDSIQPFILVMPDCSTDKQEDRPIHHTLGDNLMHYSQLCHDYSLEFALEDLMQHIDTTYRVSGYCAIADLSSGARIAANIVNRYPGKFQSVGLFSPVIYKDQLPSSATSEATTKYYIYVGKDDIFISNSRRFQKRLAKKGVPHSYTETNGGHTWRNWRLYLTDFLLQQHQ